MLLSLDRAYIEGEDFTAAQPTGNRWMASTLGLVEDLGARSFQRNSDAEVATVRAHKGGISRSPLYGRQRGLPKRDVDELLSALETHSRYSAPTPTVTRRDPPPVMFYPL